MEESVRIQPSDYQRLKDRLPYKYATKVQSILKTRNPDSEEIAKSTISRVLSGDLYMEEVLLALIEVAEEEEMKWKRLRKAMNGKLPVSKLKFQLQA